MYCIQNYVSQTNKVIKNFLFHQPKCFMKLIAQCFFNVELNNWKLFHLQLLDCNDMAKTTPKKGRSASRGRAAAAAAAAAKPAKPVTPEPPKTPKTPVSPKHEMEFEEGAKIMAR